MDSLAFRRTALICVDRRGVWTPIGAAKVLIIPRLDGSKFGAYFTDEGRFRCCGHLPRTESSGLTIRPFVPIKMARIAVDKSGAELVVDLAPPRPGLGLKRPNRRERALGVPRTWHHRSARTSLPICRTVAPPMCAPPADDGVQHRSGRERFSRSPAVVPLRSCPPRPSWLFHNARA